MTQPNGWRRTTVTVSLLVALVAGSIFVVTFGFKALGGMREVTEERMKEHRERDIDLSHPTLKGKYTQDRDFQKSMGQITGDIREIKRDINLIEAQMGETKEALKALTRRLGRLGYR